MVKPKSFRPWNPEQTLLLLPSPVDWLPENHLVFFLLDLAGELDLEEIHAFYWQQDPHGEKACWEDAAFRVLTGNQQPDHGWITDFRRRHLPAPRSRLVPFIFLLVAFAIKLAQRFGPPLAVTADFWWVLISGDWSFPLTWQARRLTPPAGSSAAPGAPAPAPHPGQPHRARPPGPGWAGRRRRRRRLLPRHR